jgi:hypothetical protein
MVSMGGSSGRIKTLVNHKYSQVISAQNETAVLRIHFDEFILIVQPLKSQSVVPHYFFGRRFILKF